MKTEGRDRCPRYAEPYLTRFRIPEDSHVSPPPTVRLAQHPDQRLSSTVHRPGPRLGLVQFRHGPGTLRFRYGGRPPTRRLARTEVRYRQATPARVVLRSSGQDRHAPLPTRRPHLLRSAVAVDVGRLAQPTTRPGPGRHDTRPTLYDPGHQRPVSRLCRAGGLEDPAGSGQASLERRVAESLEGSASRTARRLDRNRADRSRVIRQVAVPGDPTPGWHPFMRINTGG